MSLIADVFITTKGRDNLLRRSLKSFMENTEHGTYRLTIVDDTGGERRAQRPYFYEADHTIIHRENMGLGPSINQALAHIDSLNRWYEDPQAGDYSKVAAFICYCQDDVIYTKNWLPTLATRFLALEHQFKLAFASGIESIEHPVEKDLGNGMLIKKWIRATNMFARRSTWMSMFPIPSFDPETGRVRAKPNDGIGSGVDWWFIRNHEKSVVKSGRNCLVMPGLLQHAGYAESTWLKRELPESESDKAKIREA